MCLGQAQATPPAQTWPTIDGVVQLNNFRFGTGETLPSSSSTTSLSARRTAMPQATRQRGAASPRHGGDAHSLLNPLFSNVLFTPAACSTSQNTSSSCRRHWSWRKLQASDGLHMKFPAYDYDDMVRSQRQMLDEMKIDHLRLILAPRWAACNRSCGAKPILASPMRWRPLPVCPCRLPAATA